MTRPAEAGERIFGIALGGAFALVAAMGMGRFVYTPILPFMEAELGLTKSDGGLIASANYLGYLLGALGAAWARLPGGQRRWFLGALAASAVSTAAMAIAGTMPVFLILRFIGGVASAFVLVLASTLVLDRVMRAGRPGLFALHFAGVGAGITVSSVLVAQMAVQGFGWQAFWLASGCVSIGALLAARVLVPRRRSAIETEHAKGAPGPIGRPLVSLIISYGLFGFGYVILATFISAMVREAPEIRHLESIVWLVVGLAGMPSVALWAWIGRRWGYRAAYAGAAVVQAFGVAISIFTTSAIAVLLGAVLLGSTFIAGTSVGLVYGRELSSRDPRLVLGLMTAAFGVGQIVGPIFAGIVSDETGSLMIPLLGAAAALLVSAALAPSVRPRANSR